MSLQLSKMATVKLLISFYILLFVILEADTKSRIDYLKKLELAQEHIKRVANQISCGVPRPKIFSIKTTSMKLMPSATVLHRCGKQAGCCSDPTHTCVAKDKKKVKLYFLVKSFPGLSGRRSRIKKFVMTNHTECHCSDIRRRPR